MPKTGEEVQGFLLISELGAGSFARVFLAQELDLSRRSVVIKISSKFPGEAGTLARLQHTNIVPIYSVHQHGRFHVVCMPYLGASTLSDLLKDLSVGTPVRSGKGVASTLIHRMSRTWREGSSPAIPGSAERVGRPEVLENSHVPKQLKQLENLNYEEFVLWLVAELADGLSHAHERGVLHRDIKPANILLTDEGRPMLLDFNLAADRNDPLPMESSVGGTLRYMSPEALQGVLHSQSSPPIAVCDERSDIYSLGVVLLELLARRPSTPDRTGDWKTAISEMIEDRQKTIPHAITELKETSHAVRSILQQALDPVPARRYESAAQLRDDLRCQLANLPLKFAPDRSIPERARKWMKRHPTLSSSASISIVSLAFIVSLVLALLARQNYVASLERTNRLGLITEHLSSARSLLVGESAAQAELEAGLEECKKGLELANMLPKDRSTEQLTGELLLQQSHGLRAFAIRQSIAEKRSETIASAWKAHELAEPRLSDKELRVLWQAQHVSLLRLQKLPYEKEMAKLEAEVGAIPNQSRDAYASTALDSLRKQSKSKATDSKYWLARGRLEQMLRLHQEALSSLRMAMELAPQSPWPAYHLALLNLELGRHSEAEALFDRVIPLTNENEEAYFNRALARIALQKVEGAIADLNHIESHAAQYPRLYFVRELAKRSLGDQKGAAEDLQKGLALSPLQALDWNARGEARLRTRPPDAKGALADFSAAIEADPLLRQAYENKAHVQSELLSDISGAISTLGDAVQHFPEYALARSSRAVLLARNGKNDEARAEAERAISQERSAIICYQVACVFLLTNQNPQDEAKAMSLLKETVLKQPSLADVMPTDPDLDRVRTSTELRSTIEAINRLR